jgi:hypothetical protein
MTTPGQNPSELHDMASRVLGLAVNAKVRATAGKPY